MDRQRAGQRVDGPGRIFSWFQTLPHDSLLFRLGNPFYQFIMLCHKYVQLLPGKQVTSLLTSRGCPYQCTYCDRSVFGSKWRARSPQSVLDEMEEAVRDLDIGFFIIGDDTFTMDKHRVQEICRGILDRGWRFRGNAQRGSEETLGWMKKAGC